MKSRQVLVILVAWIFIAFLITAYDHYSLFSDFSDGPSRSYTFLTNLASNLAAAFLGGLIGGSFLIFYVNEYLRDKAYGYTLLAVGVAFVLIVALITLLVGQIFVRSVKSTDRS